MPEVAELQKMKLAELREECESRGLDAKGNKTELVERLQAWLEERGADTDAVEDVMDAAEDVVDAAEDGDVDQEVLLLAEKTEEEEEEDFAKDEGAAENNDVDMSMSTPLFPAASSSPAKDPGSSEKKKNVVKISPPASSGGEKLLQRAKRFNVAASGESKKAVRLARFGLSAESPPPSSSPSPAGGSAVLASNNNNSGESAASLDQLKKRAERFGAVSTVLQRAEGQERLRKRKARFAFGSLAAEEGGELTAEARRRKRVERFRNA